MKELRDYSGEFDPDLSLDDFSKDALVGIVKLYSQLFMGVDGIWYSTVRDRHGEEEALTCSKLVYTTQFPGTSRT